MDEAKTIGADQVVATDDDNAITNLPLLDAVADTVNGRTAEKLIAKVKQEGIFASVLGAPQNAGNYSAVKVVYVIAKPDSKIVRSMAEAFRDGMLVIPISQKLPLSEATEAQAAAEKGVSGRSCLWLDIILRTENMKGQPGMKRRLRGINRASRPSGDGCVECLASPKGWWLHLRRCAECGHIGCCDSSPSQHASKHAAATGHPIIASFEPGENWFFDYEKQEMIKGLELLPPHSHPHNQPAPGPAGKLPANWESLLN